MGVVSQVIKVPFLRMGPFYLKICLRTLRRALCNQRFIWRISASISLEASLIDFPYKSINSIAYLSSTDRRLLFKTASNSFTFRLLTVFLYLLICGEIFICEVFHRRHVGELCEFYKPLFPPIVLSETI